jgi:tripartite-type tricarboxylate transporter receptor subunit TctC
VVEALRGAMAEILKMPDVQKRLIDAGDEPAAMTPDEVQTFLREERQRWAKVIRTASITAQ